MARIRTIKPEFWTDLRVGECSPNARLLFIASWNFSDDHGGLDRSSKQLKAQAFPYDDINAEPLIVELIEQGLFIEYQVAGKKYLHISGFRKHQRVEKPASPRIPVYDESLKVPRPVAEESVRIHRGVTVSSLEGNGMEGKGRRVSVPSEPHSSAKPLEDTQTVFEHWKAVWNHPRAGLDEKRKSVIARALKHYSPADLCESIAGYRHSPHHTGQNDSSTVYDDIGLFLRDSAHVDAGLQFARAPPQLTSKTAQHNVHVLADWQPPETRDETTRRTEISDDDGESGRVIRQAALPPIR